jgi:hypothetical protein
MGEKKRAPQHPHDPVRMVGRSRSAARWSVIARTDSRAPLGRQGDRHSGSGDRASRRLRVKHRRIAVSRDGDSDTQRGPAHAGENLGRIQQAKDNDQFPHASAPGGDRLSERVAVLYRDGTVLSAGRARSRHLPRSSKSGAICSSGPLGRGVAVVGPNWGMAMPPIMTSAPAGSDPMRNARRPLRPRAHPAIQRPKDVDLVAKAARWTLPDKVLIPSLKMAP